MITVLADTSALVSLEAVPGNPATRVNGGGGAGPEGLNEGADAEL